MASGDQYRVKAAELRAKAKQESNTAVQDELEGLAAAYIRLAEQAERNSMIDVFYETPLPTAPSQPTEPEAKC